MTGVLRREEDTKKEKHRGKSNVKMEGRDWNDVPTSQEVLAAIRN
jgi:hypothetical protein